MFTLPVSGVELAFRQPSGAEDVLLQEATPCDTAAALVLVSRLAQPVDGSKLDWSKLSITDLETILLLIRQMTFGDLIRADTRCIAEKCSTRVDVSFRVSEYLSHHKPSTPRGVEPAGDEGWFRFRDEQIKFRLPNGADLMEIGSMPTAERELMQRCIEPAEISAKSRRRIERAMESLAPCLSHEVQGECPECHTIMRIYFDVQAYVLDELRKHGTSVYDDVHLLALYYKWSEKSILDLPRNRRLRYVASLQQGAIA
jgi:hypothetical protein